MLGISLTSAIKEMLSTVDKMLLSGKEIYIFQIKGLVPKMPKKGAKIGKLFGNLKDIFLIHNWLEYIDIWYGVSLVFRVSSLFK